jgi:hypothetical protein
MKTATRILAIAGAGLMSGTVLGVGPAQAATGTGQGPAGLSVSQAQPPDWNDDVIGYYNSRRLCERIGRAGQWSDRWESYDCDFVRWGYHRGAWRLSVDRGWDWDGPDGDHHGGDGDHDGGYHGGDGDHDGGHHGGGGGGH